MKGLLHLEKSPETGDFETATLGDPIPWREHGTGEAVFRQDLDQVVAGLVRVTIVRHDALEFIFEQKANRAIAFGLKRCNLLRVLRSGGRNRVKVAGVFRTVWSDIMLHVLYYFVARRVARTCKPFGSKIMVTCHKACTCTIS